jgi:branched-chain amino acid transport system substrate-binding protein
VQRAVTEAREEGKGVAGRPFLVVHADTRGEPDVAAAEAVRLISVNRVAALLAGPGAVPAERLLRADQPYGLPVVVPGELPEPAPAAPVRALGARLAARGRALARYATHDLKASRAVILTDSRDPAAGELAAAFVREWPHGAGAGAEEWTYASAADLPGLAGRAGKARPDLVLVAGAIADFRTLRGRLADAGLRGPVLYGGEDAGTAPAEGAGSGPEVYLATVYCADKLTDRGKEFARRYEADFREPPDLYAAQAYDGARLLFEVLGRAQATEPTVVREELARTETFETVTGPVAWAAQGVRRTLFVVRMKGGRAEVVQTVEPGGD